MYTFAVTDKFFEILHEQGSALLACPQVPQPDKGLCIARNHDAGYEEVVKYTLYEKLEPMQVLGVGLAYPIMSKDLARTGLEYLDFLRFGNGSQLQLLEVVKGGNNA